MSTRIKGVALLLKIGTPAVDYKADVTACTLENEQADDDTVTFADAAEGEVRDFFLRITAVQSTDPTSLWSHIWDHSGDTVGFTYAPHGNEVATEAQPHFIGTAVIGPKPTVGGEAGRTNTFTFETEWKVEGTPVKDTGTP